MNLFNYFRYHPLAKRKPVEPSAAPSPAPYVSQVANPFDEPKYKNYEDYLAALAGPQDRTLDEQASMEAFEQHLDSMNKPGYGLLSPEPPSGPASQEQPIPTPGSFGVLETDRNPLLPSPEKSAAGELFKKFKPEQMDLDFGKGSAASKENLEAAQEARASGELVNRLGKAAELIGSGFGRTKPVAGSLFDENIKAASRPVQELEEKIALEKKDPNSPYSQGFRQYLKRFGVNVSGDFSGEQGEKMIPWALSQYNNELHRQTQKEINAQNTLERSREFDLRQKALEQKAEEMKIAKEAVADAKSKVQLDKRFDTMGKLIDAEISSSRSAFGKGANIIRGAEAIEKLAENIDPNQLTEAQITEIARNLDSMLSSGAATVAGTKKLIPHSLVGDVAGIARYITNLPIGNQQGAFVRNMLETVKRERELATEQVKRNQGKLLGSYSNLKEADPERWKLIMKLHHLPEDIFDEPSAEKPASREPAMSGPVKIRRKSDGLVKTLDAQAAQKYLADPSKFEQVQ